MQTLNSFANHVGGLTTQTVKARTHRFHSRTLGFTCSGVSTNPTKFLISDPSLLSTRGSNPYLGRASAVRNRQRPLGVEFNYIGVRDEDGIQRIYNFDVAFLQNHFGSNPDQIRSNCQNQTDHKFKNFLFGTRCNYRTVHSEEKNQYKRHTRPEKVAAGSKGFIHILSIAGETK